MKTNFRRISIFLFVGVFLGTLLLMAPVPSVFSEEPKAKVMTRNLYLGADIFKVVEAAQTNPGSVPYVVAEVYQTMLYTNFWARAEAIADEIARDKPQVIGVQEVSTFYIQTPGDLYILDEYNNPIPNPDSEPAEDVVIDFYTVLDAALKARGLEYDAFTVTNADVELPMADINAGPPLYLSDVRMVDHDVVLVRKGHAAWEVLADNYSTNVGLDLGGVYVEFTRGYVVVDVDVKGEIFRFVDTHLEVRSAPDSVFRVVQSAQMQELIGILDYLSSLDPKPIIMVGDLNSSPTDVPGYGYHPEYGWLPYVPPYMQAISAGYLDSWLLQSQYDEGYTSGFDETISNPYDTLGSRIDLIFLDPLDLTLNKVKCDVVGDEMTDMIPNPNAPGMYLWPSDHAGVVAKIKFLEPY